MLKIIENTTIEASPQQVWNVLAIHFGNIAQFSPDIKKSDYLTEQQTGVGTTRHCVMRMGGQVQEQVTVWQEQQKFAFEIVGGNMPIAKGSGMTFELEEVVADNDEFKTVLKAQGNFKLKKAFALLSFMMRPMMRKMIKSYIQDIVKATQNKNTHARVHDHSQK